MNAIIPDMHISSPGKTECCQEKEIYDSLLKLDNAAILELGCGSAMMTRAIAAEGEGRSIIATEVDEIQHQLNLESPVGGVEFMLAGAQDIPLDDNCVDCVLMFKSLHHVPMELLPNALQEIHRVLKPDGLAYFSEPVYAGDFNDMIRLFHDEQEVREKAFAALQHSIENGLFSLERQVFFDTVIHFDDFAAFEQQIIGATHTRHHLSEQTYQQVQAMFNSKLGSDGADFTAPMRVDLLRKT